jgi:adenylate kinase
LSRGRQDDHESVIRNRLHVYRQQTEPLIEFYRSRQQLISVNGDQTMEAVNGELQQVITR